MPRQTADWIRPILSTTKDDFIMAGQPKAPFYVTLGVVVLALLAYSAYRFRDVLAPAPKGP
ncbi:MAG TPA: hypothetical protein VKB78_00425, partial [Pirellulales bacterium]|nr:hypothetical protein [Pirellulales bacterium]